MAHGVTELKNYKKARSTEVEDAESEFKCLPDNVIHVKVKTGSKLQNLLRFAIKAFKEEENRHIIFSGIARAVTKTISCAEVMKRKFKGVHQITKIKYKRIEDIWEPKIDSLDVLKVTRDVPAVYILLCKDEPPNKDESGYQAPGICDAFWKQNKENTDRSTYHSRAPKRDRAGGFRHPKSLADSSSSKT